MKGGLHLTLNTVSCRSDLPSLMTLSWVSQLNDPSHGLTSWQLISHALSKFWICRVRSQVRHQQIASSIQTKRLVIAFDCKSSSLLLLAAATKCEAVSLKMVANKTQKLQKNYKARCNWCNVYHYFSQL